MFHEHAHAVIYGGAALLALGNGLMWPSVLAVLSRRAGGEHQGAVQGIAGSIGAFASILGLVVGGLLYDVAQGGVFVLSAAIIGLVVVLALGLREPV